MADIICRWRNGTPQTVVELVNALPHEKMPIDEFRSIMEKRWEGFFRTAYQLACQLALYCESEDGYYYPRFDHNITESEARSWLLNWLPKYYVPNPFTKKDGFNDIECPTFVLKALYDYVREHGVCSYALAFKNVFHEETRNNDDIIKNYINNYSRVLSFSKYGNLEIVGSYEEVFGDMNRNDKKGFFDSFDEKKCVSTSNLSPNFTPTQIIYYGVPGCGKSYEVNKVINVELDKYGVTDKEYHKVRCVFHPEYCNADFVGQIYPYVKPDNGGVEYRFKPGPFAEIVRRAYRNPAEPFFLVIEEINRGNAAAIFGEMFQLLDRIRPEDGPEELSGNIYNTGWSSYGVTNIDVNAYVRQKSTDNPEKIEYDDSIPYGDKIKFINNTAVRLPPNLSIYATMNTNDQNVFTMDNAFQRRFKSKMIRNVLDENSAQYKTEIDDTGVCWGNFREWINEKILAPETGLKKAEDKCLGGWFIKGEKKTDQNGKVSNESKDFPKDEFAEKVLKYLWNDVFKRSAAENIFLKGKVSSLTNLIELFESGEKFAAFENVFVINAADKAKLLSQKNNP